MESVCVSVTVLFEVCTIYCMFTVAHYAAVHDILLRRRIGQGLLLDDKSACQKEGLF
jgi:hypothetical protein